MADAGRIAVPWLQAESSLTQLGQLPLETLELGDPRLDICVAPLDQLSDDPARCFAGVADAEHLPNLCQRKADRLRRTDESQAVERVIGIRPIARRYAARGWQ